MPIGPGGSLGAWLADWLARSLHPAGQRLLYGACLFLGTVLALDFVVVRWLAILEHLVCACGRGAIRISLPFE